MTKNDKIYRYINVIINDTGEILEIGSDTVDVREMIFKWMPQHIIKDNTITVTTKDYIFCCQVIAKEEKIIDLKQQIELYDGGDDYLISHDYDLDYSQDIVEAQDDYISYLIGVLDRLDRINDQNEG